MKKSMLFYFLLAVVALAGCKKDNGPVPQSVPLERVPAPLIVKDATGSAAIDMTNLAGFNGKVNVSLYFPNDIPPSKLDIVIRKNNNNNDIRAFQLAVTSFPTALNITAAQLATLFGEPVALGDNYDIGADVYTQSGKKFEAFPTIGAGYAAAFQPDHPGFSASVRFSAICQYNSVDYQGNFEVVSDEFDLLPGEVVTLTRIDDTHFSFLHPVATNPVPIVVTVNPLTNVISVPQQLGGAAYRFNPAQYTNPLIETVNDNRNVVSPCAREFGLVLKYGLTFNGTPGFAFTGSFYLLLRKN